MYSSLNDQLAFGRAILSNALLPPPLTRRWLKPWTHTASLRTSVGAPWEIARLTSLAADGRVVDAYAKIGTFAVYGAVLVLLPDVGLVASVLQATPTPANITRALWQHTLERLVPAAEAVAREQAAAAYAGVYVAAAGESAGTNGSSNGTYMRIAVDEAAPGLRVSELRIGGHEVAGIIGTLGADYYGAGNWSWRLYPTGLTSPPPCPPSSATTTTTLAAGTRVGFRAVAGRQPPADGSDVPQTACDEVWQTPDSGMYGSKAWDEFVFTLGADGRAATVEARAWRLTLRRVADRDSTTSTNSIDDTAADSTMQ
jgi:hypothetical protein